MPDNRPNKNGKTIEDVMDDLNKMLSGLTGGSKKKDGTASGRANKSWNGGGDGGDGGGDSDEELPNPKVILGVIAVLALVWAGFSSTYSVNVFDQAVVTRFAAFHKTTESGLHFKLPFGIDKVTLVPLGNRIIREEFGFRTRSTRNQRTKYQKGSHSSESLMLTGDLNVADVEWILQYRINDPWKYLYHAKNVGKNIRDVSISVMRRVVGDRLVSDVLTTGRVEVADQARILTQKVLDRYDMGVTVKSIFLQDVNPPKEVRMAFNEVNAAKQEQEETINNAERRYNSVIPEAKGKADKLISAAKAYSTELLNRSKGDAAKFTSVLKAYKKSPEITRKRMYLETMRTIFIDVEKLTIVDPKIKGLLPIYGQAGPSATSPKSIQTRQTAGG